MECTVPPPQADVHDLFCILVDALCAASQYGIVNNIQSEHAKMQEVTVHSEAVEIQNYDFDKRRKRKASLRVAAWNFDHMRLRRPRRSALLNLNTRPRAMFVRKICKTKGNSLFIMGYTSAIDLASIDRKWL